MKVHVALLVVVAFFATTQSVFAQSFSKAQKDPSNYYAIRQQFLDHWEGRTPGKGEGYNVFKRWEWFWKNRIMPDGTFPPADITEVEWNKYLSTLPETAKSPTANWTSMGPNSSNSGYNGIGRVNCVTVDPTNSDIIWAGTPAGGLWKSTNGGASWSTNTDNFTVLGVTAVVIDPTNTDIMYIGTGDGFAGDTRSRGVLKSTDGGETWSTTGLTWNGTINLYIRNMAIHPTSPNIVLVAASNGIYRTTDSGATFVKESGGDVFDIKLSPADPNIIYAATNNRLLKSSNIGDTWTTSFTVPDSDRLGIAVTPANPAMVAAVSSSDATNSFGGFNGLYVSSDTGKTYVMRSDSPNLLNGSITGSGASGQGWYDLCIAVSPVDSNMIFVGGVNLWRSDDGGVSWSLATHWNNSNDVPPGTSVVHADKHALTWDGNTLYKGCDGGVYRTADFGATWTDISSNLTISQMYRLGVSQSDNKVITGLQDNGTKLHSNTGNWTDNIGGDGMECFIHPTNPNIMYGEWQYGNIRRSTNGGNNWTNIHENVPGEPQGAWITPFVMDPNNSSTIYAGYREVFKSTDQGDNWESISADIVTNIFNMQHIVVAPSSSNTIYISDGDQIYRTTDGGGSWNKVNGNLPGFGTITYLAVDPGDANTVYATFDGYSSVYKVYKSTTGGGTWTSLSATLPNLPVNCITVQPNSGGVLYIGMDVGVYRREPGATSWELFNAGLPNTPVTELEIRHSTGKIRAATYGRGLWESDLAPLNPVLSINPANLDFPAAGGELTLMLNTSCDWSVTNIPAWLSVTPTSGSAGAVTVTLTASPNNTIDSQSVVIAFSGCDGQVTQNVTATQSGQTSAVNDPNKVSHNSIVCIPNPVNASASFLIKTAHSQTVHLDIVAADGRTVASLKNIAVKPGENTIPWQPRDLPAGEYLFRCFFEREMISGKVVVLR